MTKNKDVIKSNKLDILPFVFKRNITLEQVQDIRSLISSGLPFILGMYIIHVHITKTCINTRRGNFAFLMANMFEKII